MSADTTAILEARGLIVGYGGTPVLSGIDLQLRRGQVVALIGPNGSGKSTLLKTVSGQLPPMGGTMLLDGRELAGLSAAQLARTLAVLLTTHPRVELATCADVVEMGRYPHTGSLGLLTSRDRQAVRDALELVGIWELRDREFSQLSDGQRQRVLLARAICQEPHLLVLDEPTSHLDIRFQLELVDLLRRLAHERGMAVLTTLHELPLARRACDWAVCVRDGGVSIQGPADDVFRADVIERLFDLVPGTYDARTGGLMP